MSDNRKMAIRPVKEDGLPVTKLGLFYEDGQFVGKQAACTITSDVGGPTFVTVTLLVDGTDLRIDV